MYVDVVKCRGQWMSWPDTLHTLDDHRMAPDVDAADASLFGVAGLVDLVGLLVGERRGSSLDGLEGCDLPDLGCLPTGLDLLETANTGIQRQRHGGLLV